MGVLLAVSVPPSAGAFYAGDMPLRIRIDRSACHGAGVCTRRAPGTFQLGDDDIATVLDAPTDDDAAILEAARHCPHFAIEVSSDDA